jgi:hypothetical protein
LQVSRLRNASEFTQQSSEGAHTQTDLIIHQNAHLAPKQINKIETIYLTHLKECKEFLKYAFGNKLLQGIKKGMIKGKL